MNNAFRKEPDAEKPHVRNSVRDTFGNGCIYSTIPVKTKKQGFEVKRKTVHHVLKLFRMLFSDRKNLLSLYNAVNGSSYEDPDALEIVTLENAVYMGMKNDLAFIVDTGLFLYEHQSTKNPNMPLRNLLYVADLYSVLTKDMFLYGELPVAIPEPRFVVFYNGENEKSSGICLKIMIK